MKRVTDTDLWDAVKLLATLFLSAGCLYAVFTAIVYIAATDFEEVVAAAVASECMIGKDLGRGHRSSARTRS